MIAVRQMRHGNMKADVIPLKRRNVSPEQHYAIRADFSHYLKCLGGTPSSPLWKTMRSASDSICVYVQYIKKVVQMEHPEFDKSLSLYRSSPSTSSI